MGWHNLIDINGQAVIPDDVTEIPDYELPHRGAIGSSLKKVIFPKGIRVIGKHGFDECVNLESADFPDGLEVIGDYAFRFCRHLIISRIPDSVVKIGNGAFDSCTIADSLDFPNLVELGSAAFNECWGLKHIYIPASLGVIGWGAFLRCKDLESITVDPGNPNYSSEGNCLLSKDGKQLIQGCNTSVIPEGVEEIGIGAFTGMTELKCISIPKSLTKIERSPFMECWSLESITVDPDNPSYKSEGNCLLTKDGSTLIVGCKNSVIPFGVKTIGKGAFWGCQTLERIVIPESVMEIGQDAFHHCRKLTAITIPDSVTSIGYSAFLYCSNLKEVRIKNPELMKNASADSAQIVRK